MTVDINAFLSHHPHIKHQLQLVTSSLKRRQLHGAFPCAKATLDVLRSILGHCKFSSTDHMLRVIKAVGRELIAAAPSELAIGNMTRRILFLIRDEHNAKLRAMEDGTSAPQRDRTVSMASLTSTDSEPITTPNSPSTNPTLTLSSVLGLEAAVATSSVDYHVMLPEMRQAVMSSISELNDELDNVNQPIAEVAQEHIHNNECILTIGASYTVERFLLSAAKKRKYQVIIAEEAPLLTGYALAANLSNQPNISVTVVPDSAIFALMSRVNKVVISPQAVMADGGAICLAGHQLVTTAAQHYAIPVICVTGSYKLTPLFGHNQLHILNQHHCPAVALPYNTDVNSDLAEVAVPMYDYIAPECIDLYVTNNGSHQASYMFRLLSEYFHADDYNLE